MRPKTRDTRSSPTHHPPTFLEIRAAPFFFFCPTRKLFFVSFRSLLTTSPTCREHPAEEVYVTGTFDNWTKSVKLDKEGSVFQKTVQLENPSEKIYYKVSQQLPGVCSIVPPALPCLRQRHRRIAYSVVVARAVISIALPNMSLGSKTFSGQRRDVDVTRYELQLLPESQTYTAVCRVSTSPVGRQSDTQDNELLSLHG